MSHKEQKGARKSVRGNSNFRGEIGSSQSKKVKRTFTGEIEDAEAFVDD